MLYTHPTGDCSFLITITMTAFVSIFTLGWEMVQYPFLIAMAECIALRNHRRFVTTFVNVFLLEVGLGIFFLAFAFMTTFLLWLGAVLWWLYDHGMERANNPETRRDFMMDGLLFSVIAILTECIIYVIKRLIRWRKAKHAVSEQASMMTPVVSVHTYFAENDCMICWNSKSTVLFLPCRHMVVCEACCNEYMCSEIQTRGNVTCPKCRDSVKECFIPPSPGKEVVVISDDDDSCNEE